MNKRIIFGTIILVVGWVIIISGFYIFSQKHVDERILYLDAIVSCLLFGLICFDFFRPLVAMDVEQPKQIGSLGIRWFFTYGYTFIAIIVMLVGYYCHFAFSVSAFIQALLFLIFFVGIFASVNAADKVERVAVEENAKLDGRESIKKALHRLVDEASLSSELPPNVMCQIREIHESARFVTPSDLSEAKKYEEEIVRIADDIRLALANYSINEYKIGSNMSRLKLALENRKKCLSRR